jgi:hypothetical protein
VMAPCLPNPFYCIHVLAASSHAAPAPLHHFIFCPGLSNGLLNEWSKVKAGIPVLEALLQGREVHSSSSGQPSQPAEAPGSSGSGGEAGPSDSCGRPDMTLASKPIPGANDAVDRGEAEGQSAGQSGGSSLEPGVWAGWVKEATRALNM